MDPETDHRPLTMRKKGMSSGIKFTKGEDRTKMYLAATDNYW